ncbi:MAG: LPS export ABC transporter permease LptG [Sphingomonadales bacterium]|nr:LPS export ABC transporter permease LptG [Sphingomonadales bacterium]
MHFFPSRQITWYMAKLFLVRTLAVLAMLVLILQTLDLLGESGKILAVKGNSQSDLWAYIGMRAPQIVARMLPFSVLLGTLITFTTLSQNSEVVAMKAAGLSAHQILAPLIVASLFVAITSFLFNDHIVAPATAKLKQWQDVEYGPVPADSGIKTNIWVREGQDIINAQMVAAENGETKLTGVTVYLRTQNVLSKVIKADSGVYRDRAWQLSNAQVFNAGTLEKEQYAQLTIGKGITPDRFQYVKVDGEALGFFPLYSAIQGLKEGGRRTSSLESILWHKISGPLSALLMPLLAAVAAFGLARSGALFLRAVIGMALGFIYFVADNFALAMGNLGAYPPFIAAWAPFLLFFLIGETVLVRTEE